MKQVFSTLLLVVCLFVTVNVSAQENKNKIDRDKKEKREKEKEREKKEKKEKDRKEEYGKEEREAEGAFEENEEYDGADKAVAFEVMRTKDPATGKVPRERLIVAIEKAKQSRADVLQRQASGARTTAALTWQERGPYTDVVGPSNGNSRANNGVASGRVRAILVDSSDATHKTVWAAGVDGGLWKTTDITASPASWTLVNDFLSNLAVTDICQDPSNNNIMYFCTGEWCYNLDAVKGNGVFKSTDHGVTWTQLSSTSAYGFCSRILCDYQGNVYLATRGNGLQRSTNGGSTWTNITPSGIGVDICDLEISSTAAAGRLHVVAGIFSTQSYRYTDIPATATSASGWNAPVTAFPSYTNRAEIACRGNLLYALPADNSYYVPTIYKSTDGGANWAATTGQPSSGWASGQGWYSLAVDINPANTNEVIIGGLEPYKTTDGGISWNKIANWTSISGQYVHADIHKIVWYDNGNKLLFGCDGGLHFSSDGGTTIRDRNVGLRIKQFYSCAIHPSTTNYFLGGAQDNGTHQLTSAGLGSSVEVVGGDGGFVAIDQDEPQYQFGAYIYNQYWRTSNGGASWNSVSFSGSEGMFINPYDYDNLNNHIYASYSAGQYLYWSDPQTGSTSSIKTINAFNGAWATAIFVSPYTSNRVYFGTSGGRIVRVDNANAATPTETNLTPAGTSGSVSCVNVGTNDQNLIASFSNYGVSNVWVSSNGGSTWTAIDGNLPDMPVRWCMFYPGDNTKAILATELGIWSTDLINGSSTVWSSHPTFPAVRTDMLKYRSLDGTIIAATHGRGLWTTTIALCGGTPGSANINAALNTVCSGTGTTLSLDRGYSEPGISYQWAYATTSGGTYTNLGTASTQSTGNLTANTYYKCTITCSGSGLSYTTPEKLISINPVAQITAASNSPVCPGQSLNIAGTSDQVTATYSWSGPNGFTSTQLSPSISNITAAAAGVYTLTATYNGCSSTVSTTVAVNAAGPSATGVSVCLGGSGSLLSSAVCNSFTNAGTSISGSWNAATDPTANRPNSTSNSTVCTFSAVTRNYTSVDFQVSTTGSYTFEMNNNAAYDAMGYIVSGGFTPGSCTTGTLVIGDDDGGILGDEPLMTTTLTAGVTYTLISTTYSTSAGTYSGSYQWTITPPSGGQIMLPGSSAVNWYTVATGGTAIGSGSPFNPVGVAGSGLSNTNTAGTTVYYVGCPASVCRTAASFTILALPSSAAAGNGQRCGPGTVTISATPGAGETIDWYSASTGGTLLLSGNTSYTTPSISSSTTYYAEARNISSNCISATRTAVTATITSGTLTPPAAINGTRCGTGTVSISATPGAGETIDWYSASTGGTLLLSGNTLYTTPSISSSTTYYAEARNIATGCISSSRTAVVATVTTGLASPSGTGASRCGVGTVTISATPGAGETIDWYSAATGGTLLLSGSNSYSPSISATTTYYAEARNTTNGCTSTARTAVTATLLNPAAPTATNAARCGTGTVIISATPPAGCVIDWYAASTGGTALLSGSSNYTTASISSSTTYYAQARNTSTGCTSLTRTAVTATINTVPAASSTSSGFSCAPTNILFEAYPGAGETIDWYTAATGGTIYLSATPSFTEFRSTTVTYYAQVRNISTGCVSATRTAAQGSILQPAAPGAGNAARCGTGTVTISATPGSGETIDWYDAATGGTLLLSGSALFTTPSISSTTIYYAEARSTSILNNCVSTTRTAVTATVSSAPAAPTAGNASRCGTGTVTISATPGSGETIDWYDAATGGTLLLSGNNSYTTPSISTTTTYYAQTRVISGGCLSATRTAVTATVNAAPVAPSAGNASRCGTGTVTISATPGAGETIDWYSASTGGTLLLSGNNSYTTPSISASTTYYALARNTTTGCVSATRTAVTATVNAAPSAPTAGNASRCGTGTVTITATPGAGETIDWYSASTGGTLLLSGNTSYTTASISTTTTYYAEARKTATGCVSATRTAVTATVKATSSSNTNASVCSAQLPYVWNGNNYTATGIYTVHLTNAAGCDSAATLNLTVKQESSSTTNVSVCTNQLPYVWNGNDYTTTGTYIVHLTNAAGCDSAATLNLTLKQVGTSTTNASVCSNQTPYVWNGNNYTATGIYEVHLNNALGCDSVATLNLTVKQETSSSTSASVCANQLPYVWNGFSYSSTGSYVVHFVNAAGCDSSATLNLTVKTLPVVNAGTYASVDVNAGTVALSGTPAGGSFSGAGVSGNIFDPVAAGIGTFTITYNYTDATTGCSNSATTSITVTSTECTFTVGSISGPANACQFMGAIGDTATYSINAVGASGYTWTVSNSSTMQIISGQGSNSIRIKYSSTFLSGTVTVVVNSSCAVPVTQNLAVSKALPAVPTVIVGPANACVYIGTGTPVTYSIAPVAGALSYTWTLPANVSLISGQGTTSIQVLFNTGYITSLIKVKSVSGCGSSGDRSLSVATTAPAMPGAITGPTNACIYIGSSDSATYTIRKVANTSSYNWIMPAGATILSHPAGTGANDTIIRVQFDNNFVTLTTIGVQASSVCGTSATRTLSITRTLATVPGTISGPIDACPLMQSATNPTGTQVNYKIRKVSTATSYNWTVPTGASIDAHPGGAGINDTSILVTFSSTYVSGAIAVQAINGCGSSAARTLTVSRKLPATPASISGPADACPLMGTTTNAVYTIRRVTYATSYTWSVPTGAVITDHPGGAGSINDTIIVVSYSNSFVSGMVTVFANANCGSSGVRSLTITRKTPTTPGAVTAGLLSACPARLYSYTINPVLNAVSYAWTVPAGGTIVSGQGTTSITVSYDPTVITGAVKVSSVSNCYTSQPRTLTVNLPACPPMVASAVDGIKNMINTNELTLLDATVIPNPSADHFRIAASSNDMKTLIEMIVTDVNGRVIEYRTKIKAGAITEIGSEYRQGVYFVEIRQGNNKKQLKIVKM